MVVVWWVVVWVFGEFCCFVRWVLCWFLFVVFLLYVLGFCFCDRFGLVCCLLRGWWLLWDYCWLILLVVFWFYWKVLWISVEWCFCCWVVEYWWFWFGLCWELVLVIDSFRIVGWWGLLVWWWIGLGGVDWYGVWLVWWVFLVYGWWVLWMVFWY